MDVKLYSGAGNTFVVLDGRQALLHPDVQALCKQYSTDGLMVLKSAEGYDFAMEYYNSDGSGGMMCGNGGRCIVAFARDCGILPSDGSAYHFLAPDGEHLAYLLPDGNIRLKMIDVKDFHPSVDGGWFLDTGTRHYVKFVSDTEALDIESLGAHYRHLSEFSPIGVNANFVQSLSPDTIRVRTFEKGVEAETLACGTGITASALACCLRDSGGEGAQASKAGQKWHFKVQARKDMLEVEFLFDGHIFREVYLTGPAVEYSL